MVRRLVMHEIGHLYGLLDVDDPTEMMNPALTTDDWGDGDLAGLSVTHDSGCSDNRLLETLADTAAREANVGFVSDIHQGRAFTDQIGPDADWEILLANHIAAHTHRTGGSDCGCGEPDSEDTESEGVLVDMVGTSTEDDDEEDTHKNDCGCTSCC